MFHSVSLSSCFPIHTGTPKRMEKILSFSEAINDQQLTGLKWVLCRASSILRLTVGRILGKGMNYLFNFLVVYPAVDGFTDHLCKGLSVCMQFRTHAEMDTR